MVILVAVTGRHRPRCGRVQAVNGSVVSLEIYRMHRRREVLLSTATIRYRVQFALNSAKKLEEKKGKTGSVPRFAILLLTIFYSSNASSVAFLELLA